MAMIFEILSPKRSDKNWKFQNDGYTSNVI